MKKKNIKIYEDDLFNNKNFIYALGFLWADGYVNYKPEKSKWEINLSIVKEDALKIVDTFLSFGEWKVNDKKMPGNRRLQLRLSIVSREFAEFLIENGYKSKTYESACNILSKIPEKLHNYWFRGLVDGDGCFCMPCGRNNFLVAGPYSQDWRYMENICNKLGIYYFINRSIRKNNSKASCFKISNIDGIIKFGNFIYMNCDSILDIGLNRKYEKFKQILAKERKRDIKYRWIAKSGKKYLYDFQYKGQRFTKCGFETEIEAYKDCVILRKSLGIKITYENIQSS